MYVDILYLYHTIKENYDEGLKERIEFSWRKKNENF